MREYAAEIEEPIVFVVGAMAHGRVWHACIESM